MMAVNTTFKIGLVIGLAGAIFPVIRRYSNWSTPGTVIVGSVFALIAAIWFVETPLTEEEALAAELAHGADGQALSDLELGVPILIRDQSYFLKTGFPANGFTGIVDSVSHSRSQSDAEESCPRAHQLPYERHDGNG